MKLDINSNKITRQSSSHPIPSYPINRQVLSIYPHPKKKRASSDLTCLLTYLLASYILLFLLLTLLLLLHHYL